MASSSGLEMAVARRRLLITTLLCVLTATMRGAGSAHVKLMADFAVPGVADVDRATARVGWRSFIVPGERLALMTTHE